MKTFSLKANLLAGLSHTINLLTPQQKCCVDTTNPVKANALVISIVKDIEEANAAFMAATKEVGDKKVASFEALKAELEKESEGMTDIQKKDLAAIKTNQYRLEDAKIQAASTAKPDEVTTVALSEDKIEALKVLFPLTVGSWNDSALFVETAQALENAV